MPKKRAAECIVFIKTQRVANFRAQESGDRLQSELKEDDGTRHLLSPNVELDSNLLTRVKEHHKRTFGKCNLPKFPIKTATWCIFARHCMWVTFKHEPRDVHKRCQKG